MTICEKCFNTLSSEYFECLKCKSKCCLNCMIIYCPKCNLYTICWFCLRTFMTRDDIHTGYWCLKCRYQQIEMDNVNLD